MTGDDGFDPARLEAADFDVVRRGFDPTEVRALLQRAADEIRHLRNQRDELEGRLSEADTVATGELEASRVAAALGVEAAHVLEAAHQAARERSERADREAEAVRSEAVAAAEAARTEAREEAAAAMTDARNEADAVLTEARRQAEELVDEGRVRGREMVTEAQAVRERMLGDLAKRRQTGRAQVEQLRAARDRLMESVAAVQGNLEASMTDLVASLPEARAAADRAGIRVTSEAALSAGEMESEIESSRVVGHPLADELDDAGPGASVFDTGEMESLSHLDDLQEAPDATMAVPAVETAEPEAAEPAIAESAVDEDAADVDEPESESESESKSESESDGVELYDGQAGDAEDDEAEDDEAEAGDAESEDPVAETDVAETDAIEPEPAEDAPPAEPDESAADDDDPSGVDVLFAKLRESHGEDPPDPPPEAPADDDPRAGARAGAASVVEKALKKVLVDEQGTLLDGIRRSGPDAVQFVADDPVTHAAAYHEAARPGLVAFASGLGADAVDLDPAMALIDQIALEPVRRRLVEVAEGTDDPDELSDTVRAVYRESRSRRIAAAAAAAVVATDGLTVLAIADGPVRWLVAPDGPCGADCADNELAGDTDPGDEFPTGDRHPPSHSACTCHLVVAADLA